MRIVRSRTGSRYGPRFRPFALLPCAAALLAACQSGAVAPAPTAAPTAAPTTVVVPTAPRVENKPVSGGPTVLRSNIALRRVARVVGGSIKLAHNPANGDLYYLAAEGSLYRVPLKESGNMARLVAAAAETTLGGTAAGMAIGPDGTFYVVSNQKVEETKTQAVVRRGVAASDNTIRWDTLATTEPYPLSNTPFDHMFNGMLVSADGKLLYLNSGSRTDHGEVEDNKGAFPNTREVGLTAKIFRIPTDAKELVLPNDEAALASKGYIFARGTRNAYDLAWAPNGDLFAVDNGPDADYPDELNWLREGQHYGFPWKFGMNDNPQQFPGYDSSKDKRLSMDFTAVKEGKYHDDPTYPKPPGPFTAPVINRGPDAAVYRLDNGDEQNAAAKGETLNSFTPHRSPLGLVFANSDKLPAELRASGDSFSAFVLSWGAAGGTLSDKGQDLLHLTLHKQGDNYEMTSVQIAADFKRPIDAVMIDNKLYVLENGENGSIWELTFQGT